MNTRYADFADLIELTTVVGSGRQGTQERQTFFCPYCQRNFSIRNKDVKFEKIEPDTVVSWREDSVKIAYIACECKVRFILRYINLQGDRHTLKRWFDERRAPDTMTELEGSGNLVRMMY